MTMAAKIHACPSSGNDQKCLKECPTNVKEAIDWIICLAGKNGCNCQEKQPKDDPNECVKKVAEAIVTLLSKLRKDGDTSIKDGWPDIDELSMNGDDSSKFYTYIAELINGLAKRLTNFLGCIQCKKKQCGQCTSGQCTSGLAGAKYTYCYLSGSECCKHSKEKDQTRCAKILLGCIPLIFYSLTYLYWNCCDNGKSAKWKDCNVTTDSTDELCIYLVTLGFDTQHLNKCNGGQINALLCCFTELSDWLPSKTSDKKSKSYADFINNIQNSSTNTEQGEDTQKKQEQGKKMPLQRLYTGASSYFQAFQQKHNKKVDEANRPNTICELLYWLLGLPFTPVGMEVETNTLNVLLGIEEDDSAASGGCSYLPSEKCCKSQPPASECPMTPAEADPYLLPPCHYAAFVLLSIQGSLVSGKNKTVEQQSSSGGSDNPTPDPFLHELYANQHFEFYYPSSIRSWAAMVWDVVYALYFRLGFLYRQCKLEYKTGYGWKDCGYGKDVACSDSQTWICTASQDNNAQHDQCGKDPKRCSPLQGYLCDKLKDFRCIKNDEESKPKSETEPKSYCTHLDHLPPSQWCPIPFGFEMNMKNLTPERKGAHLSVILELYFEENTDGSSLYQLLLFLSIVSLRPPRCLGDMFAFFCGIGRLCDANPPPKDESLDKLWKDKIEEYPGTPNLEKVTESLKSLAGSCKDGNSPTDTCVSLCSLSPPDGSKCNTKYLCSLSWSIYTVFATRHIECYLSWVVYLVDDFQSRLKQFLEDFENVECNSGCLECKSGQKCHKVNQSSGCKCNVVKCKRIHGALYRYGFRYQDASSLESGNSKTCTDFLQQLKKVAEGKPLQELIKVVNQMLYSIRLAFVFWAWLLWTVAIVYLVFGLVVDLDILHIRSHIWLKHTHNIPAFNLFAARRLKYGIQVYFGR